ncbi:MAG: SDR family oxidoreductase [Cyanobacteria bacterium J06598_1]
MPKRSALITGASSGIGKATAIAFADAGFDLLLIARSQTKLSALANELQAKGVKAEGVAIDLSEVAQVKHRVERAIAAFHSTDVATGETSLDTVVNCAGMGYTGPLHTMPLADWQQVMAMNVTSVLQVVQAVLPDMRAKGKGMIVNIASIAAQHSFPDWGAYGVSKSALVALSGAIAAEESDNGIRVVTVSPGAVNTPIWDSETVQADFDRTLMLMPETIAQTILYTVLMPPGAVISELTITPSQGAL